ncbi:MAG: flagellar basal body-associated FliL family protein [Nocardioides sp.]|uniref:flagellar basal body-associated FliL family protein n=1 Tax=Nocardioides TaxID=1839 RepID=UPI0007028732|nr:MULTISPECIES: flagellar basal body-associated FliL family protein [Nocardioides]KQQ39745.1 hypothetical protein ASF50_17980 [Nocardioides sp. Leaf307]MBJ7528880.1 flagellar basal body-associated FliL family protein [Nocardioides sp.]
MTTTTLPAAEATAAEPKKSKKKLIVIALVLVLAAGAAYWFVLKPSGAEAAPEPGEVLVLEPVQVNLESGHYLRVGIALQLTADAHEADGSKALDATIELFSGRTVEELAVGEDREKLKEKLNHTLEEEYHGDVMEVYFTEFVTQ